jgi:glycosyltransferase involved in cell wall biosynthesis
VTLRILVVHNHYRSAFPSGENQVVDEQVTMLRTAGVEVKTYFRSSDEIPTLPLVERAALPLRPIRSPQDSRRLTATLRSFRPTVVHLHNPYPLISPAVIRTAVKAGVPVVQTVHNYRHACVAGTLFRAGSMCTDCVTTRLPWPAAAHGCYRDSRAQSLIMAAAALRHRSTWLLVDRFLAVSRFVAERLVEFGLPAERITVVPNAVPDPGPPMPIGRGFLFAGRLDRAKGLRLLLDAWTQAGIGDAASLAIAGDGPDRPFVERAARRYPSIRFHGTLAPGDVGRAATASAVTVVPSLSPESFGRTAVEAFARGRPALTTTLGALGQVVDERVGWTAPANTADWAAALAGVTADPDAVVAKGREARRRYKALYHPDVLLDRLMAIYVSLSRTGGSGSAEQGGHQGEQGQLHAGIGERLGDPGDRQQVQQHRQGER